MTREIALEKACVGIWKKSALGGAERIGRDITCDSNVAGAKARLLLWSFCGTTEVMPCYKARFDGVLAGRYPKAKKQSFSPVTKLASMEFLQEPDRFA